MFLRVRVELPRELALYLADAFDRITGETTANRIAGEDTALREGWVPGVLLHSQVSSLLKSRYPRENAENALNIRRPPWRPPEPEYIRRAQQFLLAWDLSIEFQRLAKEKSRQEKEWANFKRQKLSELRAFGVSREVERTRVKRWRERWKRGQHKTSRAWGKKQVASRHGVSIRVLERAWKQYGAGLRSCELADSPLGEAEGRVLRLARPKPVSDAMSRWIANVNRKIKKLRADARSRA